MMFRFGQFVLLLALGNVFAEKRLPAVPYGNLVSSIPNAPPLHRVLLHTQHFQVQSLRPSSFRRSLQSTEATCAWDADSEECSLSVSSMKDLLEDSNTEFAELLVEALGCVEKTNKVDCNKEAACLWDEELDECDHTDLRRNHEDSPCANAAPRYFDTLEASTMCGKQGSRSSCEGSRQCAWSSENALCHAEHYLIMFGIENFREKVAQVGDSETADLRLDYAAQGLSPDFTWESMLDYKPSNVDCPRGIEPLVCEYFDAYIPHILGPEFYCFGKYDSAPSGCNSDHLCIWDTASAQCESDESRALSTARLAGTRVLIDSMQNGIDKRMLEAIFSCSGISERGRCDGICVWNPRSGGCEVRENHLAAILAEPATTSRDALCTYINVSGSSGCYDQYRETDCQRREFCRWTSNDVCEPKEQLYLSAAADLDPSLETRYRQVRRQCSENPPPGECVADNNASSRITFSAWTLLLVCSCIHYMVLFH